MQSLSFDEKQREANEEAKALPGNADIYDVSLVLTDKTSPLFGKTIIFLGSSVTVGALSFGQACADFLQAKDGIIALKEAVSGTTLADDDHDGTSYIERMHTIPTDIHVDAFVCQLSTNDAWKGKAMGTVAAEGPYDTGTVAGAMQHVVEYARATWHCPVLFYTGTYFESDAYAQMVELLMQIKELMGISVIDLYHDEEMRTVSPEDYALYMHDPIHPTKAGYELWWTPKFEDVLEEVLAPPHQTVEPPAQPASDDGAVAPDSHAASRAPLRKAQRKMLLESIAFDAVGVGCIVGSIVTGTWWPLIAALPIGATIATDLVKTYSHDARDEEERS